MKLSELHFNNNDILGNLVLDFKNTMTGKPYDTILLVGENGAGKTTILKEISSFMGGDALSLHFSKIVYDVNGDTLIEEIPHDARDASDFIRIHDGNSERLVYGWNNGYGRDTDKMINEPLDPRHYGSLMSFPRSDFQTGTIDKIGVSELDTQSHEKDQEHNFTSLKQLLVDLNASDEHEFSQRHRNGDNVSMAQFDTESKMYRFKHAFNQFFDDLTFSEIRDNNGAKEIYFKKFGHEIPIDSLSTGEKQIVYRGIFLLRHLNKLKGGILLIDEPELSMHPRWQDKILKYYQDLFSDPVTHQMQVQLIAATHSERILSSAFENPSMNGVIVLGNENGMVTASPVNAPGVLPVVTSAETIYLAYKIPTVDYHIELFSLIQRTGDPSGREMNVSQTDAYIMRHRNYDSARHARPDSFTDRGGHTTHYNTLPTFVRNRIDHPRPGDQYTAAQLRESIELMRTIIQNP